MVVIRILIALIQAILKVVAEAFVKGGAVLISALVVLALCTGALWLAALLAISVFRKVRSR